jgi:hypothetical protein
VNWSVSPGAILVNGAVTAIAFSTAAVTVKLKAGEEVTPFILAVILVLPMATWVANPWVPAVLLMVSAAVFDEFHVAALVRFCVEPSEYWPVAVNWSLLPAVAWLKAGVTVIDVTAAPVTVKLKTGEEVTPFRLAVIFVLPTATPVTNPSVPAVLLMVATAVFDEFQVAALVKFCVEPPE